MTSQGPLFTWCNKREEGLICKKLDRALINSEWYSAYPQSYCIFESGGCSDHMRCRIQIKAPTAKPRQSFKFTNALTSLPGFLPLVDSYWKDTEVLFNSTYALFRLSKKLKALKPVLRALSKDKLGNLPKRTKAAYDKLCDYQTENMLHPSASALEEESRAYSKWQFLAELEEKFL